MLGGTRRRLPALCAVVLSLAGALASCGGDDQSAADEKKQYAEATEPEDAFIKRMAKLLATTSKKKDCAQLNEISGRSYARFTCPAARSLRKSMASFKVVGAEDYGTGAVVDYKSGKVKDGAAILLFVAPDRTWGISRFGIITKPSTGTEDDESRQGYREAVDAYLRAVVERDCEAFKEVAFTGDIKPKDVCKTAFADTELLAKRLKANRSAKPKYEGGNATYGFFTLETMKPEAVRSTISVVKSNAGSVAPYVVLDVAPSPTSAEQREVIRQFRQRQREKRKTDMQPGGSSKPLPQTNTDK